MTTPPVGERRTARRGRPSPCGHTSRGDSSGPVSTMPGSRRHSSGRVPVRPSVSWTSADFPNPHFSFIRPIGAKTSMSSNLFPIGTGPDAKARRSKSWLWPTRKRSNSSLTANRSVKSRSTLMTWCNGKSPISRASCWPSAKSRAGKFRARWSRRPARLWPSNSFQTVHR